MDAIERAVVAPQIKIVEKRAAWRQIFRNRPPLASRAQHIHHPVHHFAHVDVALVATAPGRWDQRLYMRPFVVTHLRGAMRRLSRQRVRAPSRSSIRTATLSSSL